MSFKIQYDDDQLAVISMVNEELKKEGINAQFEFDNEEYDGFEICTLMRK